MGKKSSKLKPAVLRDLKETTDFTEEEILIWYKSFKKDCPSGQLTRAEFKKLYEDIFTEGDSAMFAEHVFRTFDVNNDGAIDFREFLCAINVTSPGQLNNKLKWVFNMYDINGDGYISYDEMVEIVASIYKMFGTTEAQASPVKTADNIFRKLDKNKDGQLSLDEFIEGAQNDPLLLKQLQGESIDM